MYVPIVLDPGGPATPPAVDVAFADAIANLQGDIQYTVVASLVVGGLLLAGFAAALLLGRLCLAKRRGVALRDLGDFEDATSLWGVRWEPSGFHSGAYRSVFETTGGSFAVNASTYGVLAASLDRPAREFPLAIPEAAAQPLCVLAAQFAADGDISPRILTPSGSPAGIHWDFRDLAPDMLLDFHRQAVGIIRLAYAEKKRESLIENRALCEREKARLLAEAGESLRNVDRA